MANIKKRDVTIQIKDINAINNKLTSFSQSHRPLDFNKLPAYLPSYVPPPRVQPWEVFNVLYVLYFMYFMFEKQGGLMICLPKSSRDLLTNLSTPVTDILNKSFSQGIVPTQWKQANVVPIPKQMPPTLQ